MNLDNMDFSIERAIFDTLSIEQKYAYIAILDDFLTNPPFVMEEVLCCEDKAPLLIEVSHLIDYNSRILNVNQKDFDEAEVFFEKSLFQPVTYLASVKDYLIWDTLLFTCSKIIELQTIIVEDPNYVKYANDILCDIFRQFGYDKDMIKQKIKRIDSFIPKFI